MRRPLSLLAVPLLCFGGQAQADFYSHRYAGVGYSDTTLDGFCDGADAFVQGLANRGEAASAGTCNDSGDGWKIYGGWRWSPYLAVEGSYQQLTDAEFDFRVDGERDDYLIFQDKIETRLINAFIVGHWPLLDGLSLFGKLGGGVWNSDFSEHQSGELYFVFPVNEETVAEELLPVQGRAGDRDSGVHWSYGLGISYRYRNSWSLRAEWESFGDVGSDDFRSAFDVETASLGWSMHF